MSYRTILDTTSAEFTEKRSRFISYLAPVDSEDCALKFVADIRSKHRDARHNVYAYALVGDFYRYSDDGEPQGTAGPPILDIIKSERLFNCVAVVTRYFGGVLLGTGGLVRAYSQAVKLAARKAKIVKLAQYQGFSLFCDYRIYDKIYTLIKAKNGIIVKSDFLENVCLEFYVPVALSDNVVNSLKGLGIQPFEVTLLCKKYLSIR